MEASGHGVGSRMHFCLDRSYHEMIAQDVLYNATKFSFINLCGFLLSFIDVFCW